MNRQAKKQRAKMRSQRYASERILAALLNGPPRHGKGETAVLRHGKTITFYDADGRPSKLN